MSGSGPGPGPGPGPGVVGCGDGALVRPGVLPYS